MNEGYMSSRSTGMKYVTVVLEVEVDPDSFLAQQGLDQWLDQARSLVARTAKTLVDGSVGQIHAVRRLA